VIIKNRKQEELFKDSFNVKFTMKIETYKRVERAEKSKGEFA
jgi:hypothetical protein